MRKYLSQSISNRLSLEISSQNPVKVLKEYPPEAYLDVVITNVYLATLPRSKRANSETLYFAEVICSLGKAIMGRLKIKTPYMSGKNPEGLQYSLDSGLASKIGAFIMYSFEELGLVHLSMGQGLNSHATYILQATNRPVLLSLFETVEMTKTEKLPKLRPEAPWVTHRHPTGAKIVKTQSSEVLEQLTAEAHPYLFKMLNKAQECGWRIHKDVLELEGWALRNRAAAFDDIWKAPSEQSSTSKHREATTIIDMASRYAGETFYHLYYADFRGRKYTHTAYLHEQSSDVARGLLLRADSKEIGEEGYYWLLISIASNWGGPSGREDGLKTDKIPLKERYEWALDNEELLLSYAESPKVHQGWMKADKPWQFIAACFELRKLRTWQRAVSTFGSDPLSFKSSLEVYIDGSTNGSQHLAALTRDEIAAPHVNLVPSELPGDLYALVATAVWRGIDEEYAAMSDERIRECENLIEELYDLKEKAREIGPGSVKHQDIIDMVISLRRESDTLLNDCGIVFWHHVRDAKARRKIVKRNTMTVPYGGTPYGMSQQQIDDASKHGIPEILYGEHRWFARMGRATFAACGMVMKRSMKLLTIFEEAGRAAEKRGEYLSWKVPITGFPVVQHYTVGTVRKVWVYYGPATGERQSTGYHKNALQINVCFTEVEQPATRKQAQGAAPNIIHSLDAAHLMMIVDACDFHVTTIHDSFGCLLADMPVLFKKTRECFVELYEADPLEDLMEQIDGAIEDVEFGTLDLSLILESEYAFA